MVVPTPTLELEEECLRAGDRVVCGVDEVGRGAWAGPATVCAVVPGDDHLDGVRDSKLLTPAQREVAAAAVRAWARGIGVGHASAEECDALGMTAALRLAGRRALRSLARRAGLRPDRVLLDGNHDYLALRGGDRVRTVVKGDTTSLAMAAASVVAKVTRDALMGSEAEHYPAYGFEQNRGYPAPQHRAALAAWGPSAIHRRSWAFMGSLIWPALVPADLLPDPTLFEPGGASCSSPKLMPVPSI